MIRLDGNLGDQVTLIAQWALLGTEEDDLKTYAANGISGAGLSNQIDSKEKAHGVFWSLDIGIYLANFKIRWCL